MADQPGHRCEKLKRTCRKCEHEFQEGETRCPVCGKERRCLKEAVAGYRFCIWHGGPRPKYGYYGKGTLITGSKSRFPLTRLAAKYNEMQSDARLLSNKRSIEMVDVRILELAERIDLNQAPDRMANLRKIWEKYKRARFQDELEAMKLYKKLDEEFEAAYHDYAAWSQMFESLDLRRKIIESEVKVLKDMKAIMTAEEGYELIAKIFAIIIQIEDDPKKLKRYEYEFTRIVGDGAVVDAERGSREAADEEGSYRMDQEGILHTGDEE